MATALRRAAVRATRAPSIHNTQPWRLVVGRHHLDLYTDPTRRLQTLDPRARQLTLSCGCALLNARVSLAASGVGVSIERFTDHATPQLAARINVDRFEPVAAELAPLDAAIETRQTNRRMFTDKTVPPDVVRQLAAAAAAEGAELRPVASLQHRNAVARLSREAERQELRDPAYRAELRAWTSDDSERRDGIDVVTVPRGDSAVWNDLIRDFDVYGAGRLPSSSSSLTEHLFVLGAPGDDARSWLRAGEALERVLLLIEQIGYATSPLTQVIEVPQTKAELVRELRLDTFPQLILRIGRAPRAPESRRRRLVDMISEAR